MEERIYIEAELMYKKANDFKSIEGNLRKWVGYIKTINMDYLTIKIDIPETFPIEPPIIKIDPPISHTKIDKTGKIDLQLLRNWNPEYHIYQIIDNLKAFFWRELPQKSDNIKKIKEKKQRTEEIIPARQEIKPNSSVDEIDIPKQEMENKIQMQLPLDEIPPFLKDKILDLQSDKISVANLVECLDEFFQKGELTPENYSKLYKKYYNILVLINEELKKVSNE